MFESYSMIQLANSNERKLYLISLAFKEKQGFYRFILYLMFSCLQNIVFKSNLLGNRTLNMLHEFQSNLVQSSLVYSSLFQSILVYSSLIQSTLVYSSLVYLSVCKVLFLIRLDLKFLITNSASYAYIYAQMYHLRRIIAFLYALIKLKVYKGYLGYNYLLWHSHDPT